MKIQKNEDAELVEEVLRQLKENDKYCPCRLHHTPENKCMCKAFRDKVAAAKATGDTTPFECDCGLYMFK